MDIISGINRFFRWPEFTDDVDYNRRVSLLHVFTIFAFVIDIICLGFSFILDGFNFSMQMVSLAILIDILVIRWLLFWNRMKLASLWLLISGILTVTASIIVLGGMQTPVAALYLIIIIIGGILYGLRGVIPVSLASTLCVGGLLWYFHSHQVAVLPYSIEQVSAIIYGALFLLGGFLINFTMRTTSETLNHARKEIAERKLAEHKLRDSEKQFRSLFEQTHDAVIMMSLDGKMIQANPRAAEMMGYSLSEFLDLPQESIPVGEINHKEILQRLLDGENIPHFTETFQRKDGSPVYVEIYADIVLDDYNQPARLQIVARDISERRMAEENLRVANEQLSARIKEVERLQNELREQAIRDPLTGLYNRRYLTETLFREIARSKRERLQMSLLVLDLDLFKRINDTYGHNAGDYCLVDIARRLLACTRESDIVCRYGGEEFIVVMSNANVSVASLRAEEIRKLIETQPAYYQEEIFRLTVSIGLACYPDHGLTPEDLISHADEALYESKENGRNRVTVYTPQEKGHPHVRQMAHTEDTE